MKHEVLFLCFGVGVLDRMCRAATLRTTESNAHRNAVVRCCKHSLAVSICNCRELHSELIEVFRALGEEIGIADAV